VLYQNPEPQTLNDSEIVKSSFAGESKAASKPASPAADDEEEEEE
jgi:hypothetical protein